MESIFTPHGERGFYGIKNDWADKKFGSKTAVDNLNITLTNGVYGLLGAKWCRENNAYAAALQYPKSYFRENSA